MRPEPGRALRSRTRPPGSGSHGDPADWDGQNSVDLILWEWRERPQEKREPEPETTEIPKKSRWAGVWRIVGGLFRRVGRSEMPTGRPGGTTLSYLPGLDGMRALAVIAVLLYHAGLTWVPGGFLGVEVFFVISGYLITALLLAEWRQKGSIDLKAFWLRRARRLLPALYLLLVGTLAFAVIFLPAEVARLRDDVVAALGYFTNWLLIFNQESYFEAAGRPSLLRHLWSLAVEEQFYIVWPLLMTAALMFLPRRYWMPAVLGGAVTSAVLMAVLYQPGVDPSRIYYGTDTRAAGLLFGAALAFVWAPELIRVGNRYDPGARHRPLQRARRHVRHRLGWTVPRLLDLVGLAALGMLIWFCLSLDEFRPFLYQGGFALVAIVTALLILIVVHPRAQVGAGVLGWGPMRWVGLRSYSIYLWHWPVFMVTRPQLDLPIEGVPLFVLRMVATFVLADLSYRFVETPIRRGALERSWRSLREAEGARRLRLGLQWAGGTACTLALCVVLGLAVVQAEAPEQPQFAAAKQKIHSSTPDTAAAAVRPENAPAKQAPQEGAAQEAAPAEPAPADEPPDNASPGVPAEGVVGPVSAVGDSVMIGAVPNLENRIETLSTINAEIGFQAADVIAVLEQRQAAGQLGEVVVIHVGNNGPLRAWEFDEMMRIIGEQRRAVFVNAKVPRNWELRNNTVIAQGVERYPNAALVDWYGASANRPELFWDDGMHLRPEGGARLYAELIAAKIYGS
ncbi:MAG TPA: acyltransferase family protein [Rubrobacteraceae bacterium]|nr:acyltransferase family protein [Rubrobacteraceae bacterium]